MLHCHSDLRGVGDRGTGERRGRGRSIGSVASRAILQVFTETLK